MADKPIETDEKEAERRFNETLGRLANTPHKPHRAAKPKGQGGRRKPA